MKVLDPLAFAVAACRAAAPDDVEVVASADVDAVANMPLAVVQTTSPSSVRNGPIAAAANPAEGDWYYYVTVNLATGETKFYEDYAGFLEGKAEYEEYCATKSDRC